MKTRYILGALVGGAIGIALSYLYSQSGGGTFTSNLWVGAFIGVLVGLYIVSAASTSDSATDADGHAVKRPQFG